MLPYNILNIHTLNNEEINRFSQSVETERPRSLKFDTNIFFMRGPCAF